MESLIKDISLNSEDSQGINWKEYEKYLNYFDEDCMNSQDFLNYCNKIAEDIRENHREMYKSSAMQCVRDVASCNKDVSIDDFCKLSERGCFVNVLEYFQKNILNEKMNDFEKGVCAYFGLMLAYIINEQSVHIIPDTFFGGKLFLEDSLCKDTTVGDPDLAFFDLILNERSSIIVIGILILAMSLTLSTIDTLINAISSLIIVNGDQINKSLTGKEIKNKANLIILLLSVLVFILASKGYSILYLFLLADLLCCAAVVTIFYGFFNKKINSKLATSSILCGLIFGLLFFPSIDFQSSILVGNLIPKDLFNSLITGNLLFISFVISIVVPLIMITTYSLRNSFK